MFSIFIIFNFFFFGSELLEITFGALRNHIWCFPLKMSSVAFQRNNNPALGHLSTVRKIILHFSFSKQVKREV